MTLRTATAFLMGAAFGLLLALGLASLAQDRLARVEAGYRAGTYLAHRPDYAALYRNSQARGLDCALVRAEGTADLAVCRWSVDDRAGRATLVIDYDAEGHAVDDAEYPAPARAGLDMALAGQMADYATTAVGIGAGIAVEANPIMAPLTQGAAGWAALAAIKAGIAGHGDRLPFRDCVTWRGAAARIGWSVAAWNVVGIAVSPALGLGAAVGAWSLADAPATTDAVARCLEVR